MTTTEPEVTTIALQLPQDLPPSLLSNIEAGFKHAFEQSEKWRQQGLAIRVTSLDQKAEMKLARTIRLELKNIRVDAEKTRKKLKEDSLRMGRAIDGVNALLLAAIVPIEKHLEEQEHFAARLMEQERQRIVAERSKAIEPFLAEGQPTLPLDAMSEEQWEAYLADTKLLHDAKIEAARKAEAERIAREQAEAAERERVRLENERLKAEAEKREAEIKAEREAAEKARLEAEAKAKAEQEAVEAKARAEREKLEAQAKAEREAAEKARLAAEAKARAEREAMEAERRKSEEAARIEREKIEAAAKAEREAREKAEQEAAALRAAEAKRQQEAAAAKAAEEQAKADAAKKAARAPDKSKLTDFAKTVRALAVPEAKTEDGKRVAAEIAAKVESFAAWIEKQAASL